jgi:hypothetical protein
MLACLPTGETEALNNSETLNFSNDALGVKTSSATVKPTEKNETNQAESSEPGTKNLIGLFQALSAVAGITAIVYFKLNGELFFRRLRSFFKMQK